MMLASIFTRAAGSAIPLRLISFAAAGLTIAAAVTYHMITVAHLETAMAQAQADHASAMADIARRDAAIGELERAISNQNAAVDRMQADGQARARRAADAARRELARHSGPAPQDVSSLNSWIRQTHGDQR